MNIWRMVARFFRVGVETPSPAFTKEQLEAMVTERPQPDPTRPVIRRASVTRRPPRPKNTRETGDH